MIEEITKYDNNFDESIFLSRVDHIFIMLLEAIMQRDISTVKHYLSDEISSKYENIINNYLNSKKIRLFDEMNVKETHIQNINIVGDTINIDVLIVSRYMDYFMDEDGNYISGNNQSRIEKNNYLTFSKKMGAEELKEARRCTSCGKTLDINASGKCPYCNNIIDMSKYDYILTKIEGI